MQRIRNFKGKGGIVVYIEGKGAQATYSNKNPPKKYLMLGADVYRCSDSEWNNPPLDFVRIRAYFG